MKKINKVLLLFLTLLLFSSFIPIDEALALDGPIRNYKEAVIYIEGSSVHTAVCIQIPNSSTMKWENYHQEETKWPPTLPYDDGEYRGTLYRATQDLVRIDRLGGSCSSASDEGNQLYDDHIYRAQYKGTVQTDPLPVKPPVIVYGSCDAPSPVPPRYEYELDVQLNRIDARTVDINTTTDTDVYLEREDFSSSRSQAKSEFNNYINQVNAAKSDCQSKIAQWQGLLSQMQSNLATCNSQERPNCYVFSDAINLYNSQIAQGQAMLPVYDQRINQAKQELNYILSNEVMYQTITPTVLLRHDGVQVGSISLTLSEGQVKRETFPPWIVPSQGKNIMAQINENGPYEEFRYSNLKSRTKVSMGFNTSLGHILYPNAASNNWKDVTQRVATYETAVCTADDHFKGQTITGIVRTVNDNGNLRELLEEVTVTFTKLPRDHMRAGYGFDYELSSVYRNHDTEPNPSDETGTKIIESYFPTQANYLPYERGGSRPSFDLNGNSIPNQGIDEGFRMWMETHHPDIPRNETKAWSLPPVAIESYSGNVFSINNGDYLYHPNRNTSDTILTTDSNGNALKKWYTDFLEADGYYQFVVRSYDAGVNHLNTCHTGQVLVDGSYIGDENGNDDFVFRPIEPTNSFPGGTGWNWIGNEGILATLSNWWLEWLYPDPKEVPSGYHEEKYVLPRSVIKDIRKDNDEHNYNEIVPNDSFMSQYNFN